MIELKKLIKFWDDVSVSQKILMLVFLVFFGFVLSNIATNFNFSQWDFRVYYSASLCHSMGLDPYDLEVLQGVYRNVAPLPFVYPPLIIYFFKPFTYLNIESAALVFFCLKLFALCGLFYIWSKIFTFKRHIGAFLLFSLLGFNSALHIDLYNGNISVFEQFFIWLALYLFLKDKIKWFSAIILFVSFFKLLPIAFLLLLFVSRRTDRFQVLFFSSLIFLMYLVLNYLIEPFYSTNYINAVLTNTIIEGGLQNGTTLEFIRSVFAAFKIQIPGLFVIILYTLIAIAILYISYISIQKYSKRVENNNVMIVLFFALTLILVLPRFKDYSYIQALLPAYFIFTRLRNKDSFVILLILACLTSRNISIPVYRDFIEFIWYYYTYIFVFILWVFYLVELKKAKDNLLNSEPN